jgi:flagellar biosynthetic protein FliR
MRELLEALRDGQIEALVRAGALVAARVAPLTVMAPFFALREAPPSLRVATVVLLTGALGGFAVGQVDAASLASLWLPAAMAREAMVGLTFALAAAIPFYALDFGGRFVDALRGASMADVLAPPTGERTTPLGQLHLFLGVALFASLGGPRLLLEVFARTLALVPIGAPADFGRASFAFGVARLGAASLGFGLAFAAPAALCVVMVEAGLGLLGRTAPGIPVFFAGMPLRAAAGIGGVLLGLSTVIDRLPAIFRASLEAAQQLVGELAA